jgi:hypothetical protein
VRCGDGGINMTTVRMDIPASRTSMFARIFQDEGLEVMWEGPLGKRAGVEEQIVQIVFYLKGNADAGLEGGAAYAAAQRAVTKIHERFPETKIGEVQRDDSAI